MSYGSRINILPSRAVYCSVYGINNSITVKRTFCVVFLAQRINIIMPALLLLFFFVKRLQFANLLTIKRTGRQQSIASGCGRGIRAWLSLTSIICVSGDIDHFSTFMLQTSRLEIMWLIIIPCLKPQPEISITMDVQCGVVN